MTALRNFHSLCNFTPKLMEFSPLNINIDGKKIICSINVNDYYIVTVQ